MTLKMLRHSDIGDLRRLNMFVYQTAGSTLSRVVPKTVLVAKLALTL
jgi:hypothetical protein